jgi:hypothetical protein
MTKPQNPKPKITPRLGYSFNEASEGSSLSRTTLWRLIRAGKLNTVKVGARTIITAESFEKMMGAA